MIDRESTLPIGRQAKLLGMSRGSVYYLPKPVSTRDLDLMKRLDQLHFKHPFMGARQLRDQSNTQGIQVGRKHVKTLMRRMGIEAVYSKPYTSRKTRGHEIYPCLLRGITIHRVNQVWARIRPQKHLDVGAFFRMSLDEVQTKKPAFSGLRGCC